MSQRKVMYQQQKNAIIGQWDWCGVARTQVTMNSQLTRFLVVCVSLHLQKYVVNVVRAAVLSLKQDNEKMYYSFYRNFSWAHLLP